MSTLAKVAVVTGAGSGIGRRTALAFLDEGFSVALAGRRREPLEKTAAKAGSRALVIPTDVADPEAVGSLFATTRETFGRIDILFNNAGIFGPSGLFEDIPYEDWKAVLDINVTGAFLCSREAFRMMKRQTPMGGRIINNGSISAHAPRPNSAAYTTSKHAITGLTKTMSLDGRKYDIACCQIDIGNAATDLIKAILENGAGATQANGSVAMEPTLDLDHVARAIVQMAALPLEANIQFMTIMATKMPYIGRG
ncbi:Oxidoreductase, short-chain dehydrogenase/reductase family [Olavius algarvensis associated proteobacterium Delta 3]|nr:Oxidoreductase, short-chain dehydrogenase/reductase family [Olavius algarvensis associated proteobacterium Delta 3]CAB5129023.1 Oxidoreductase, short-chain dehydrogenase/reductase family [Olavius algarvensis associated proteobacterium Delta 3]